MGTGFRAGERKKLCGWAAVMLKSSVTVHIKMVKMVILYYIFYDNKIIEKCIYDQLIHKYGTTKVITKKLSKEYSGGLWYRERTAVTHTRLWKCLKPCC